MGKPPKKPPAPSVKVRRARRPPDLTAEIVREIYVILERLGAHPDALAAVNSWRDTLSDEDVLSALRAYNATGRVLTPIVEGKGTVTRKGEITPAVIRRQWPHRVELSAEAVRGTKNNAETWGLAKELGGAPYPLSDFRDDRHHSVFHFKTSADAETFATRFSGKLLPVEKPRGRRPMSDG